MHDVQVLFLQGLLVYYKLYIVDGQRIILSLCFSAILYQCQIRIDNISIETTVAPRNTKKQK